MEDCNRRKQDHWVYKLKQAAALITACGVIATAAVWLAGTVFVSKTESQTTNEKTSNLINIVNDRVVYCEKDILVIKANLQAIQDGQKEQFIMLREIRDDLRRRDR